MDQLKSKEEKKQPNVRSIRVMEKIGLKRDVKDNFAHPKLSLDHPLSQHILYRLKK